MSIWYICTFPVHVVCTWWTDCTSPARKHASNTPWAPCDIARASLMQVSSLANSLTWQRDGGTSHCGLLRIRNTAVQRCDDVDEKARAMRNIRFSAI